MVHPHHCQTLHHLRRGPSLVATSILYKYQVFHRGSESFADRTPSRIWRHLEVSDATVLGDSCCLLYLYVYPRPRQTLKIYTSDRTLWLCSKRTQSVICLSNKRSCMPSCISFWSGCDWIGQVLMENEPRCSRFRDTSRTWTLIKNPGGGLERKCSSTQFRVATRSLVTLPTIVEALPGFLSHLIPACLRNRLEICCVVANVIP